MSGLVPGHTLKSEGAAFQWDGRRYVRVYHWGVGGKGKGLCSCGATSKVLDSGAARRRWHKAHREAFSSLSGGWTPEKVQAAILAVRPFDEITTFVHGGKVQVTMAFDDLCSFAEQICGSMSEFDLTGHAKEELERWLQIGGSET